MTLNYKKKLKVSFQLGSIRMTETALAQNYLFYKTYTKNSGNILKTNRAQRSYL